MMESYLSAKRKEVVWKDYMERIMNEINDWDHNVGDGIDPVDCVYIDEVVPALNKAKTGKDPAPIRIT